MASFGQTVAEFLLLSFCLCCFYQPCLSGPRLMNFPQSCSNVNNSNKTLRIVCPYLKSYQNLTEFQTVPPIPNDSVCDTLFKMKVPLPAQIRNYISPCKETCKTFVDICLYLYFIGFHLNTESKKPLVESKNGTYSAHIPKLSFSHETPKPGDTTLSTIKMKTNASKTETIKMKTNASKTETIKMKTNASKTEMIKMKTNASKTETIKMKTNASKTETIKMKTNTSETETIKMKTNTSETGMIKMKTNASKTVTVTPSKDKKNDIKTTTTEDSISGRNQGRSNSRISYTTKENLHKHNSKNVSANTTKENNTKASNTSVKSKNISLGGQASQNSHPEYITKISDNYLTTTNMKNRPSTKIGSVITKNEGSTGASKNISPDVQATQNLQEKIKTNSDMQRVQPDSKTPVSTAYNEAPSSAHFMGYFLTAIVLCIAGYIVFHNKQKIIAFIIEGRNQKRGRRPNANEYKKLQTNVDDVMVSLDKSTTAQNYIY